MTSSGAAGGTSARAHWGPLSGCSAPVRVSIGKRFFDENLLFTHRGLSGPAILQISSYWSSGEPIVLNLTPGRDLVDKLMAVKQAKSRATPRAVLGKDTLGEMLAGLGRLNLDLQKILYSQTAAWGSKVNHVEIKHVDLNESMIRAIARQAEAERERRAKVIHAEGELQAAEKLAQAAEILARQPLAIQLRYLETLTVIAADKNSTIVFPLPMDIVVPLLDALKWRAPLSE